MRLGTFLPALLLGAALVPLGAQAPIGDAGYTIRKCEEAKVPIGSLPLVVGTASFTVGKDGKADTTSIAVYKVIGMSVAGFRSVLARKLATCRLASGKSDAVTPGTSTSEVTFADSATVLLKPVAAPEGSPLTPEPLTIPRDSFPLPLADTRIEERAMRRSCAPPRVPPPVVISGRGSTRAEARQNAQDQARMISMQQNAEYGGTLVAQVLVGIDGKPGPQVRVITLSNPSAAQYLGDMIGSCRFAPARVHGALVPSYIQMKVP